MKLADWREKTGLTQTQVAERLGVAALAVSQWETGRRFPSRENQRKIAEVTEGAVLPNDWMAAA